MDQPFSKSKLHIPVSSNDLAEFMKGWELSCQLYQSLLRRNVLAKQELSDNQLNKSLLRQIGKKKQNAIINDWPVLSVYFWDNIAQLYFGNNCFCDFFSVLPNVKLTGKVRYKGF